MTCERRGLQHERRRPDHERTLTRYLCNTGNCCRLEMTSEKTSYDPPSPQTTGWDTASQRARPYSVSFDRRVTPAQNCKSLMTPLRRLSASLLIKYHIAALRGSLSRIAHTGCSHGISAARRSKGRSWGKPDRHGLLYLSISRARTSSRVRTSDPRLAAVDRLVGHSRSGSGETPSATISANSPRRDGVETVA